jgi:hypothetical protein
MKTEVGEGTDANVYIYLIGDENETQKIFLNNANCFDGEKELFESGNIDEFKLQSSGIGKLEKIRIGHDNKHFASAWHLKKVNLNNILSNVNNYKKKLT